MGTAVTQKPAVSTDINRLMLVELEQLHAPLGKLKQLARCLDDHNTVEACDVRDFVTALIFRCEALECKLRGPVFEVALDDLLVLGTT